MYSYVFLIFNLIGNYKKLIYLLETFIERNLVNFSDIIKCSKYLLTERREKRSIERKKTDVFKNMFLTFLQISTLTKKEKV